MDGRVTDQDLAEHFKGIGSITEALVKTRYGSVSSGYGFVVFEKAEDAEKAIEQLNGSTLRFRKIKVEHVKEPSEVKEAPAEEGAGEEGVKENRNRRRKAPAKEKEPAHEEASKTAVFVANLPFGLTDEGLVGLFEGFDVQQGHVVRTRHGISRGYGFVEFNSEKDQQEAIEKLNKTIVEDPAPPKPGKEKRPPRQITVSVSRSAPRQPEETQNVN
uniref:RRM domain-containing protein n=1 Tax=Arcella intermedia TaxID=1963864 RepID=A0A6B2LH19_9EUKA